MAAFRDAERRHRRLHRPDACGRRRCGPRRAVRLTGVSDTSHPLVPAATPVLRHPDGSLRVGGVDSTDGLRLEPGTAWLADLVRGLDGRRSRRTVLADAADAGQDPAVVAVLLDRLRSAGLLVDLESADLLAADAGPAAAARTAPELADAAGRRGPRWWLRRAATVVVDGATRVGTPLAAVLAASGVGRVSVRDTGLTAAGDAVVGGLTAADEGRPRSLAAADAVRRASPLADLRPPADGRADVVVLTRAWAMSDPLVRGLQREGVPHLVATVRGQTGVVGPLVVPGTTSCLRCADLHRRDADPDWPLLAPQLTAGEPPPSGSTTTCLLTAVTGALQVLAYLDGTASPVVLGATLELRPPDPLPRLRQWPAHPECGCTGASEVPGTVTGERRTGVSTPHPTERAAGRGSQ
jgi:hypothetical protein